MADASIIRPSGLVETAPPGKKAEHFIKDRKAEFKRRYGKRWKQVLYATAWKHFGESVTFRDYFQLVESRRSDRTIDAL